ncbi:hypothetical protein [Flexivirga oryzae]|uniref:AAT family amino acid transporter n=1 Tax=Flexivirga oryzae TaxID=1794944 RepID=A0A839N7A2_9MICO|nr:hypothetical protein [Flexivirga oryzae]MBB2891516.1 AAT family amino acid transporter [Flexivirga oryzae]
MDTPATRPDRGRPWYVIGLANFAIVAALSVVSWWVLADPRWSPLGVYPLPFNASLFWAILFIVFVGFNCEFAGFNRVRQPLRGGLLMVTAAAFGIAVTWILGSGLGRLMPDFDAHRAGGSGYFTGALFVLFAFFAYVMVVLNWEHWPWPQLGLRQPVTGLCDIAFIFIPTLLIYLIWGLPAMAAHPTGYAPMTINVVLGYFYALVVATILTGLCAENLPWSTAGSGGRTALAATVGNILLGSGLYFALLGVCKLLIGTGTTQALGDAIHQFPAQLGVCWNFWIILWANAFGNWPTKRGRVTNIAARILITFGLGVATFLAYYYWIAGNLLHEPVVAGALHGNALGFLDWAVLWTLFYVVGFESYGLPAAADTLPEPVDSTQEQFATTG